MNLVANQLEYSGGVRREQGELLLDAGQSLAPTLIQRKGSLYLILEPDNMALPLAATEMELARQIQQIIVQDYYNYSGSTVTSALRTAIERANASIFSRNSKLLPAQRHGFGMSCVVLRGNELYLAQLPPTQAIMVHQGQLKYFPTPSDRVAGPRPITAPQETNSASVTSNPRRAAQPALGRYNSIEPNLLHQVFGEGDILIMVSTELVRTLRSEQTERIFLKQDGSAALYNLSDWMRSERIQNGYGIAISAVSEFAARSSATSPRRSTSNQPPIKAKPAPEYAYDDGIDEEVSAASPLTAPTTVNKVVTTPQPEVKKFETESPDPWLRREQDTLQQPPYLRGRNPNPDPPPISSAQSDNAPTAAFKPPVAPASAPANRTYTVNNRPESEAIPAPQPARPRQSQTRLDYEPANVSPFYDAANSYGQPFEQVARSQNRVVRRRFDASEILALLMARRNWLIAGAAILAVLLVLFIILGNANKNNQQQTVAANYLQQIEASRETADQLAVSDPVQARNDIEQARAILDKAKVAQPGDPHLAQELTLLQQTLDKINRVVVPPDLRLAFDATSLGAGVKLAQGVLSPDGNSLFMLDKGRGSVYQLDLSAGTAKTILKPGDKASGRDFGKPISISAHPDGLVLVDDKNTAWTFKQAAASWLATPLGGATSWTTPILQMATYSGNLYVVGPGSGQILRYLAGNYATTPENWLDPSVVDQVNVERAAVFAIDGQVYTLGNDGKLNILARKSGQTKGQISQQAQVGGNVLSPALDGPLSLNPVNFDYPYYFVVDNAKRVMQFKKEDSSFVQQFHSANGSSEFDKARDVAVDTKNSKLYIIGEQQIYGFGLTQPIASGVTVTTLGFSSATPVPTK